MRILVTGGAGFIGSNYIRLLGSILKEGIKAVTILDKLTYAGVKSNLDSVLSLPNYEFVEGDICDRELVSRLIKDVDAVVNFAAESHVDRSIGNSKPFIDTNISGVQVLLEAITKSRRSIRFLQISTDEVFGSIDSGSWDENSPLQPNSPYSASKASGELIARAYHQTYGTDVVITRCSNNYGPYQFPEKLIPLFITNLITRQKVPIYGDGSNVRDWLHVDDHCRAIHAALLNGKSGEVYNIGGGRELTNLEITHLILGEMGADETSIEHVEDRKGHDYRYAISNKKLMKQFKNLPKKNFKLGIKETIKFYINNCNF